VPIIAASNIDWQVIVVSGKGTSSQDVCFDPPLAGAACADNPPTFHQLDCTVGSSDSLTVIQQSYAFPNPFICAPGTPGWSTKARFDATKVFVEVTDDEAGPAPFFLNADMFDAWAL